MMEDEKEKIKHDFLNAVVIINSLSKSAEVIVNKITADDKVELSNRQIELFGKAMLGIRCETDKMKELFSKTLDNII